MARVRQNGESSSINSVISNRDTLNRCRANSAESRESRSDSGFGLSHFQLTPVPFSLGSGLRINTWFKREDLYAAKTDLGAELRATAASARGMCCGTEAGSYLRLIDSCITQLKAQGPSRTCNESTEEEEAARGI